jgi:signal transduction histidine kinase
MYLIGRVKDTGIGISEEDRVNLFKMFGGNIQNNVFSSGIGLGLHICKSLTEKFSGLIKIEDSEVGRGTTFIFTFLTSGASSI